MIKVKGVAILNVPYSVKLDITEEEWDALTELKQNAMIDESVDWSMACRSAEVEEIEVDIVDEV